MWDDLPELEGFRIPDLPFLQPQFFVPSLADKPQDPILHALIRTTDIPSTFSPHASTRSSGLHPSPYPEAPLSAHPSIVSHDDMEYTAEEKSQVLSWDGLRSSPYSLASSSAFLSEKDRSVFEYARYNVQPMLLDPAANLLRISLEELQASLRITVLGTSSTLHTWDTTSGTFMQVGSQNGRSGLLSIDSKDEVISDSLFARFLVIGSLMRRMEILVATLRTRSAQEGPTIHALAHTLSTILTYLRNVLDQCQVVTREGTAALVAIHKRFGIYEEILVALSDLFGRGMNCSPVDFPLLESDPVPILSRIYDHLNLHLERQSPHIICALFSFILTNTSRDYLHQLAQSVGYGEQPSRKFSHVVEERHSHYDTYGEEEENEKGEDVFDLLNQVKDEFPTFFPPKLLCTLSAAQKSLILLRIAQPDYSSLKVKDSSIRWIWTTTEIESAYQRFHLSGSPQATKPSNPERLPATSVVVYEPELIQFRVFDLEPGSSISSPLLKVKDDSVTSLQDFISSFPPVLPPVTPTLSHLTSLVFDDLLEHASNLSSKLLSLVLNPSSGNLNFPSHLHLLRSFLLITSPAFKSRLCAALFSDAEDYIIGNKAHSLAVHSLRRQSNVKFKPGTQPWAVGLSPSLLERETWPPVGADLSFFLRTVIIDSIDHEQVTAKVDQIAEEGGWRLGFAIRDLPAGTGREKWLNPIYIEALDFLYMDYKPPHPMEILVTPEVLSKYQRLFTFILRLLRVDHAVKSLFRMTRSLANPLFPTLSVSRKRLLYFRFIAQSLVANLSSYVFDTAIGGNFDFFIERLQPSKSTAENGVKPRLEDIFELARCHSSLLDDILSACLLRSGQRAVGDLLRQSLEIVLELAVVVGDLSRGRQEEYRAAHLVDDLFEKFCINMKTLMRVLRGLVEKGPSSIRWESEYLSGERRRVGGVDALYHLLLRLDLTDWWSKSRSKCRGSSLSF